MAEQTIEEARRELAGHLAEHCRPGSHPQAKCCLPVADAYALAAARATILAQTEGQPGAARLAVAAVFAEIEALGR